MSYQFPTVEELEPELQKVLKPDNPKALMMVAKGVAPFPPPILVSSWCYLVQGQDEALKIAAEKSLQEYPLSSLVAAAQSEIPAWALYSLGLRFQEKEDVLETILLNSRTPSELVVQIASQCSEKLTQIITNNQERIIDRPEIVIELEKNPNNLKSNTDRLRQFLRLAGIYIPGDDYFEQKTQELKKQDAQKTEEELAQAAQELIDSEELTEEKRMNLTRYILTLTVGAKVKLALKGNKEARSLLIKDANKTVAGAVLKSPRLTDNEVIHFSNLKNVADEVVRAIARNPAWTKNYQIKLNLVNNPKCPIDKSMGFIKTLSLRDLQQASRSKTVAGPVRKAAKALLLQKRK